MLHGCQLDSHTLFIFFSQVTGDVTIIEGIDVTSDEVGEKLKAALTGVTIDVIVHNAGGIANRDGPDAPKGLASFADGGGGPTGPKLANLESVTIERMLAAFQVNTLGPLRVQQALTSQMASPGGKVLIISSGMGSITDNGSGGLYAYRTAKAAVNMVMKNFSLDLEGEGHRGHVGESRHGHHRLWPGPGRAHAVWRDADCRLGRAALGHL